MVYKKKNKYDSRNNKTQEIGFSVKDGKYQMSEWKKEYKYDEKNRKISEEKYTIMEGKEVLTDKIKYEYDESNNKILELTYDFIDGKDVLVRKEIWKYKDGNIISTDSYKPLLEYRSYRSQDGKEVCSFRNEYKYDEKNNEIFKATFEVKEEEEKEVLTEKNQNSNTMKEIISFKP